MEAIMLNVFGEKVVKCFGKKKNQRITYNEG